MFVESIEGVVEFIKHPYDGLRSLNGLYLARRVEDFWILLRDSSVLQHTDELLANLFRSNLCEKTVYGADSNSLGVEIYRPKTIF